MQFKASVRPNWVIFVGYRRESRKTRRGNPYLPRLHLAVKRNKFLNRSLERDQIFEQKWLCKENYLLNTQHS